MTTTRAQRAEALERWADVSAIEHDRVERLGDEQVGADVGLVDVEEAHEKPEVRALRKCLHVGE